MGSRRILIAGGGLGGLTAAACLLEAGFDVDVFEQAPELGELGAGIQISANAARVLQHLGLIDALEAVAVKPEAYRFRLYDTGEVLQTIPLGESYVERHGVAYYTVHRADFHGLLAAKVRALKPDAIRLNARITGFDETPDGVSAALYDGSRVDGAVLVGADGIRSVVRRRIVGPTPINYTGDAAWRIAVPAGLLEAERRPNSVDIWVGPARHAVVYPIRRGELVNFVGAVEDEGWTEDSWTARRPWADLQSDFAEWDAGIRAIIGAADKDACYRWALNNRTPVATWSTGRATLLGDAAHPTLPYMAQGAAMAMEDAAVLTRALQQEPDVATALDLYQRNRTGRTARVVTESSANRSLFHLPSVADLRDAFARRDMNAERTAWLFSYDPMTVELS
ncbi:MAG: FAD-dependent monooxygenase [Hyphomicrobiales bacterium]